MDVFCKLRQFLDVKQNGFIFSFSLCLCVVLFYQSRVFGQDVDVMNLSGKEKIVEYGEISSFAKSVKVLYPEWYKWVVNEMREVDLDNAAKSLQPESVPTVIDTCALMRKFSVIFRKDTKKTAEKIYDFLMLLEFDEIGKKFIEEMKKDYFVSQISFGSCGGDAGNFIGTVFHGEVIHGTSNIHRYQANNGIPTIIFGPNNGCALIGGDSFDFLFGGDGDDVLCPDSNTMPTAYTKDIMAGGDGDDVYLFPKNGIAYIYENNTAVAGNNTLRIDKDVKVDSLRFSILHGSLDIIDGDMPTRSVIVFNWEPRKQEWYDKNNDSEFDPKLYKQYPPIQQIIFSDGTILNVQDINKQIKHRY